MKRHLLLFTTIISASTFAANTQDPAISTLEKSFGGEIKRIGRGSTVRFVLLRR